MAKQGFVVPGPYDLIVIARLQRRIKIGEGEVFVNLRTELLVFARVGSRPTPLSSIARQAHCQRAPQGSPCDVGAGALQIAHFAIPDVERRAEAEDDFVSVPRHSTSSTARFRAIARVNQHLFQCLFDKEQALKIDCYLFGDMGQHFFRAMIGGFAPAEA